MAFKYAYDSDSEHAGQIEVTGRILRKSPSGKAILIDDGGGAEWLPLSKIRIGQEDIKTGIVSVFLPEWLAKEKRYI